MCDILCLRGDKMKREFKFTESSPLIQCIAQNKDKLIGKKIAHYYRDSYIGTGESPAVFIIDDMAIIIFYYWYSYMDVVVVNKENFLNDTSLKFLYKDIPKSRNVYYTEYCYDDMVEFVGKRIKKITVERFSDAHETCQFLGSARPKGGDYFKTITIQMSNGKEFHICGEDALIDGYMNVW